MIELLETIITPLLSKPDVMRIEETDGEDGLTYTIYVDTEDMGRVIGGQGNRIKSIRSVVKAKTGNDMGPYRINVVEA